MSHTITKGETLSGIAKAYGTTVAQIAAANGINNPNLIRTGATLTIPGVNQTSTTSTGSVSSGNAMLDRLGQDVIAGKMSFADAYNAAYMAQQGSNNVSTLGSGSRVQGKQMVDLTGHPSGYQGMGYIDERGRAFTDYGAYLRTDNYFYPAGAKVSGNGMYFDNGNGWQFAKMTKVNNNGIASFIPSEYYGLAPGTRLDLLDNWDSPGSGSGGINALSSTAGASTSTTAATNEAPDAQEVQAMVNLLEHSYNSYIEPGWLEYISGARDY